MISSPRRFLIVLLCSLALSVYSAPLSRRAVVTINVVTSPSGRASPIPGSCSATQFAAIKQAVQSVLWYAKNANDRLNRQTGVDIRQTLPFRAFFGANANPAQISSYFAGILSKISVDSIIAVDTFDSQPDVREDEYDASVLTIECHSSDATSDAGTQSSAGDPLAKTTNYLPTVTTLFDDAWTTQTDPDEMGDPIIWNQMTPPRDFGLTMALLHEFMHARVLFANPLQDIGGTRSYALSQVQNLADNQKILNVENYVWFAMLLPIRGNLYETACGTNPGPITPTSRKRAVSPQAAPGQRPPSPGQGPRGSPLPPTANGTPNGKPPTQNPVGSQMNAPNGNGAPGAPKPMVDTRPPPANNRPPPNGAPGPSPNPNAGQQQRPGVVPPPAPNGVQKPNPNVGQQVPPNGRPAPNRLPSNGADQYGGTCPLRIEFRRK